MAEESKITLDGKEVTQQQLQEAKENQGVKIIESAPGVYKTLKKIKG